MPSKSTSSRAHVHMFSASPSGSSGNVKPGVSFADAARSPRKVAATRDEVLDISSGSDDDSSPHPFADIAPTRLASPVAIEHQTSNTSPVAPLPVDDFLSDDSLPSMEQIFREIDYDRKKKKTLGDRARPPPSSLMDVDSSEDLALSQKRAFLEDAMKLFDAHSGDAAARDTGGRSKRSSASDSLLALLTQHIGKRPRSPALPEVDDPTPLSAASDDGLSDYERRERKRLRAAPVLSPQAPGSSKPPKSRSGKRQKRGVKEMIALAQKSLASVLPTAASPLPSPKMFAKAPSVQTAATGPGLLTSPSPSSALDIDVADDPPPAFPPSTEGVSAAPTAPSTPKKHRKGKKGVMDLLAAVGADPVTPSPHSSPPSPSKSSSHIVEKRLLPPPKVNELHLDTSDAIVRSTVKKQPYPLAAAIALKSWNPNLVGPGFVRFWAWSVQCPGMDGELALSFLVFEQSAAFGNLARMDLSSVYCLRVSQSATRHHAVTQDGQPFVFLTTGFLETSQLVSPSQVGLRQKYVKIIPHEGEHQRMGSAACTVFGFDSMKTQFAKDALQFSTRAEYSAPASNNTPSSGSKVAAPGMFTGASAGGATRVSVDNFSLAHNAQVPVYDATDADGFDVNKDLPHLDSVLPPWDGEIPHGSFVVVGYTMTAFFSNSREWTLGLNIQWAVVVGVPDSE